MEKRYDILMAGMQVVDVLISGVDEGIFRTETTNPDSIQLLMGGDALNQAVTASMLGGKIALMSVVGRDRLGEVLLSQLSEYPIDLLIPKIDCETSISVVLTKPDGQRNFIVRQGHNDRFCYDHIDEQAVRASRIVSVGSCMALRSFDGADTIRLLDMARSAGVISAMDIKKNRTDYPNMDAIFESMRHVDYLLPSEADVKVLTGTDDDPVHMVQALHDLGVKNVILKLGEQGCYVSADGVEKLVPAYPANCVDTTGAGDAFTASFLHAMAKGWNIEDCARFANAAGSVSVECHGSCGAVRSEAQVLQRMKQA